MLPVKPGSLNLSLIAHLIVAIVALFGLPAILPEREEPTPMVMTVEVLPISEISNVKPSDKPIQKEQKAPTPKTPKPIEPPAAEKPKETPKEQVKEEKPVEKPKASASNFDPTEGAEPKPKEEPKKDEPKKDEPKKEEPKTEDEFAALLNKMKQDTAAVPDKTAKDKTNVAENKTKSDAPYDASMPLSISERDSIRGQFEKCWNPPVGAKDAANLAARVKIEVQEDGTVKTAVIAPDQKGRYASDTYFRAAADSAIRAVHKCSPLKNLPKDKFNSWRDIELNFDPKDML